LNDKVYLQARRSVVLSNSVLMENVPAQRCNEKWLKVYLDNKSKSGISSYKKIQIFDNGKIAIHLESKDGKI